LFVGFSQRLFGLEEYLVQFVDGNLPVIHGTTFWVIS